MGAWGVASDENDWTWDALGCGIMERASGVALTPADRIGIVKEIVEQEGSGALNQVGLCVLLLKLGCTVPLENLYIVREELVNEIPGELFPYDVEERKVEVENEIALIDAAVGNGGTVPDDPPRGCRGIFGSI